MNRRKKVSHFVTAVVLASVAALFFSACSDPASGLTDTGEASSGAGVETGAETGFFSMSERQTIMAWLGPLPATPRVDPTNRFGDDPAAATLGQALFFDERVSGDDSVSCATCHDPATGFDDTRSNVSQGAGLTTRASMPILNSAYGAAAEDAQVWQLWDGRRDSQWSQALDPIEDPNEMNGSRSDVALLLYDEYRVEYEDAFETMPQLRGEDEDRTPLVDPGTKPGDGAWERLEAADRDAVNEVFVNFGKSIGAFERLLISRNSRFDRFLEGLAAGEDNDAMTTLEKEGLRVFINKGRCLGCHSGPNFTDGQFHNIAVPQRGENIPPNDAGRAAGVESLVANEFNCSGPWSDHPDKEQCRVTQLGDAMGEVGAFKTPSLRNLTMTAPYMHTGMFTSVIQVIAHYDLGGAPAGSFDGTRDELMRPLGLSLPEREALTAFLGTLEGEPVNPALISAP